MGSTQKIFMLSLFMLGQAVCLGAGLIFKTTDSHYFAPIQAGYMLLISVAMVSAFIARRFFLLQRTSFLVVISCAIVMAALMGCDLNGMKRWICLGGGGKNSCTFFVNSFIARWVYIVQADRWCLTVTKK